MESLEPPRHGRSHQPWEMSLGPLCSSHASSAFFPLQYLTCSSSRCQDDILSFEPDKQAVYQQVYRPVYFQLVDVLLHKAQFPSDEEYGFWSSDEKEQFRIYRYSREVWACLSSRRGCRQYPATPGRPKEGHRADSFHQGILFWLWWRFGNDLVFWGGTSGFA